MSSWITACIDVIDAAGVRLVQPNSRGNYQPFRLKLPVGSVASCVDRGDGTSEVQLSVLGNTGFTAAYYVNDLPLEVPGITKLQRGANIGFAFPGGGTTLSISAVPRDGYERGMSLAGVVVFAIDGSEDIAANHIQGSCSTTGRLHLSKSGAIAGDVCTVSVTIPDAGVSFSVSVQNSTLVTLATATSTTATAGGTWAIECRYDGFTSTWYLWSVTSPAAVVGGPEFPLTTDRGIVTLDPLNLIARAEWRRKQTLALALETNSPIYYVLIGFVPDVDFEDLSSLGLDPAKNYSVVLSSRVSLVRTSDSSQFAFVDLVIPIAIRTSTGASTFVLSPTDATVSVIATSAMGTATASISAMDATHIALSVSRPTGITCTVLRHDTAIIELQEIA